MGDSALDQASPCFLSYRSVSQIWVPYLLEKSSETILLYWLSTIMDSPGLMYSSLRPSAYSAHAFRECQEGSPPNAERFLLDGGFVLISLGSSGLSFTVARIAPVTRSASWWQRGSHCQVERRHLPTTPNAESAERIQRNVVRNSE